MVKAHLALLAVAPNIRGGAVHACRGRRGGRRGGGGSCGGVCHNSGILHFCVIRLKGGAQVKESEQRKRRVGVCVDRSVSFTELTKE